MPLSRLPLWSTSLLAALLAAGLGYAAARRAGAEAGPALVARTVAIAPPIAYGKSLGSFLTARLEHMTIEADREGTRQEPPVLHARFTLTNDSTDWSAVHVAGRIVFLDAAGTRSRSATGGTRAPSTS